jgi:hypothetical protein
MTIPIGLQNTATNWDGTQTAATLRGLGWIAYTSASTQNGYRYMTSWYVKAGANTTTVSFGWGGAHNGNRTDLVFNLQTGTFTNSTIAAGEDHGRESLGNGWYRVWYTSTLWNGNAYYPQMNMGNGVVLLGGVKIDPMFSPYWRSDGSYQIRPGSSRNIYLTSLFPSSPTHWDLFRSKVWTFSALVRRADGNPITSLGVYLYSHFNGTPHTNWNGQGTLIPESNGWYRIRLKKVISGESGEVPTLVGFFGFESGVTYYLAQAELLPFDQGYISGVNGRRVTDYPTTSVSSTISDSIGWDTNPWNEQELIWDMKNHEVSAITWNGGFNGPLTRIDPTKTYRCSIWLNRKVAGSNGTFYFGTNGVNSLGQNVGVCGPADGSANTNPYFIAFNGNHPFISNRIGQWVLVVGHIHPAGSPIGSVHPNSGLYVRSGNGLTYAPISGDFIWRADNTMSNLRSYLFYCSDRSVRQQFLRPRIDVVDGNEPSIEDLLNNRENTVSELSLEQNSVYSINSTPWVDEVGGAFHFANKDDKLRTVAPVNLGNSGNASWEAVVWDDPSTRAIDGNGTMFMGMGGLPYFRMISNIWGNGTPGQIHVSANISGVQKSLYSSALPALRPYTWHHLVFTFQYDGTYTNVKVYMDGQLVARTTTPDDPVLGLRPWLGKHVTSSAVLNLGGRVNGPDRLTTGWAAGLSYHFVGKVAYARAYNRTMNEQQVAQNYNVWRARQLRSTNV